MQYGIHPSVYEDVVDIDDDFQQTSTPTIASKKKLGRPKKSQLSKSLPVTVKQEVVTPPPENKELKQSTINNKNKDFPVKVKEEVVTPPQTVKKYKQVSLDDSFSAVRRKSLENGFDETHASPDVAKPERNVQKTSSKVGKSGQRTERTSSVKSVTPDKTLSDEELSVNQEKSVKVKSEDPIVRIEKKAMPYEKPCGRCNFAIDDLDDVVKCKGGCWNVFHKKCAEVTEVTGNLPKCTTYTS